MAYLTAKWTETKWVQEASPTDFAYVGNPFRSFWLRSLIQKQNSGTVYYIRLDSAYVQHLLNLWYSHHIVIGRSSYLQKQKQNIKMGNQKKKRVNVGINKAGECAYLNDLMILVAWRTAIKAKCIGAVTVQAKHVAFTPCRISMKPADGEKRSG